MSVVHLIDTMTSWAQQNVCGKIKLKVPPRNEGEAVDEGYDYQLINPVVFPMYIPTADKLPEHIRSPFPSLCIQLVGGEDSLDGGSGFVDVRFMLSSWDPGTHGKDIIAPTTRDAIRWAQSGADTQFQRNADGWRDAWNFLDIARRAVESVTEIGGYTIDRSTSIKFGPITEQEAIADLYPFWVTWMQFRVTYEIVRNNEDYEKFL